MRSVITRAAAAAAGVVLFTDLAIAGVSPVSQDRFITVSPAGSSVTPDETFTARPEGFGIFDETLSQLYRELDGDGGLAEASQRSSITEDRFAFAGRVSVDSTDPLLQARSAFSVTFDVSERTAFDLDITYSAGGSPLGISPIDVFELFLQEDGPGGERIVIEDRELGELFPNPATGAEGVLEAGRYVFSADFLTPPTGGQERSIDFDIELGFAPAGDGGGGEPNPIPLPPAAWAGLVTMGLATAGQAIRRRRAGRGA